MTWTATREENTAYKGLLQDVQSANRRRTKRSTDSSKRPACLACGRNGGGSAEAATDDSDVTDSEITALEARKLELYRETASPTDPPPHAMLAPHPADEKYAPEEAAGGGDGGKLEHVRLFDHDHHDDFFGMHKPLWM
jgi:hypothetical protein